MGIHIEKIPKIAKYVVVEAKKGTKIELGYRKTRKGLTFHEERIRERKKTTKSKFMSDPIKRK